MNTPRRAYDLFRGYVNHEWDRIQGADPYSDAEKELHDSLENPVKFKESAPEGLIYSTTTLSQETIARRVLGVGEGASFVEIRTTFERIIKRTDPSNFPDGSEEANLASEIHRRVHRAYAILTEGMDSTEKRFRTLEIE
jgi:hypothetical protein